MKTITQVNLQISNTLAAAEAIEDKKAIQEYKKQLKLLRSVLLYLETNPSLDFIQRQFQLVEKKMVAYKKKRLEADGKLPDIRKAFIKELNKEYQITQLRKQKLVLAFLMGELKTVS